MTASRVALLPYAPGWRSETRSRTKDSAISRSAVADVIELLAAALVAHVRTGGDLASGEPDSSRPPNAATPAIPAGVLELARAKRRGK